MISWAVVAHTDRLPYALDLAKTLDATLTVDDGSLGADANHLRAWTTAQSTEHAWIAVVEDDAVPVDDITTQTQQALAVAPEPVVSMYLGQGRPVRFQERITRAMHRIEERDPHWLTATHMLHAVAVAVHTDLVEDWLDWAHESTLPIDERMTAWCLGRGHRVAYAWPSLFDHQDGPALIPADKTRPPRQRTAWRTGTRAVWTDKSQAM